MKKGLLATFVLIVLVPLIGMQQIRQPRIEITGLNPSALPTVTVTVNVFDDVGQPVGGLTAADFAVSGPLADRAQVTNVVSYSDVKVPIAVVLAIDVSSSMGGTPLDKAKAAASLLVNALGPDDPVSIVTFSSGARVVQDFTTDRDQLLRTIDNLGYGGETFLFDGALAAVNQAAAADNPRRAVILLSDGAQYDTGGFSHATSDEAVNMAVVQGVPVYTIGLGYGADRHYLQDFSTKTNALFRESPSPAELENIYSEIADLLRTQYEVTLQVDVPEDGTVYDLGLQVTTPGGIATASGRLRAPIPVPIVQLPQIPNVIDSLTDVQVEVLADDPLSGVEVALDGTSQLTLTEAPYDYVVDPEALTPGGHSLTFTATDANGDVGTATLDFVVAALPSHVSFVPALDGQEISAAQTFSLDISGQTAPLMSLLRRDSGAATALNDPYEFTIDPFTQAPGDHTLEARVTNTGGATALISGSYSVPELPIQFDTIIDGLGNNQTLSDSAAVQVNVQSSQAPVTSYRFEVNGQELASQDNTATLQAMDLAPGASTLTVTVENELGQSTSRSTSFTVAALDSIISVSGLQSGDVLEENRSVSVTTESQTAVNNLSATLDGDQIASASSGPLDVTLDVTEMAPGDHSLTVSAHNAAGRSTETTIDFSVSEGPSMTLTAMAPTATPTATETPLNDGTATLMAIRNGTLQAQSVETTATAEFNATADALVLQLTSDAQANAAASQTAESAGPAPTNAEVDSGATSTAEAIKQSTAT